MTIERFNVVQQSDDDLPPLEVPNANGKYVSYEDHARTVAELKSALKSAISELEYEFGEDDSRAQQFDKYLPASK